jgi:hypothetical protein
MKKIFKFFVIITFSGIIASCSSNRGEKTQTTEAGKVNSAGYDMMMTVDTKKSALEWEGYKPTGQHHGIVEIASGELMIKDARLTGGKISFDMNAIIVYDLTDPEWNSKLTNHLKSSDFFEVETYPEASFEITNVQPVDGTSIDKSKEIGDVVPTHQITGNLTIKGITRGITFNASIQNVDNVIVAESNMFFLDRTEWNVQYKSKKIFAGLKDDFINDEMGIRFMVVAMPSTENLASK